MASKSINERFLNTFGEVEQVLTRRLNLPADARTKFSMLVDQYLAQNAYWQSDADLLRACADIRNLQAHKRNTRNGLPVYVKSSTLHDLECVLNRLKAPILAGTWCKKHGTDRVVTVEADSSVAEVVRLAYQHDFSQFPVMKNGRFRGVVTENGVVKWLGRSLDGNDREPNLQQTIVESILRLQQAGADPRPVIFRFARTDSPIAEVMGMFALQVQLEAVLITESGGRGALKGIVTSWDAARFTGDHGHAR